MSRINAYLLVGISYIVAIAIGYGTFIVLRNELTLLWATLVADLIMTLVIFIMSLILNNSSIYDPYWSVIPPFIVFLWIIEMNHALNRLGIILIILAILLWSIRLTWNWLINWKGLSHEDWRYRHFRQQFGKWYWLISLLAIHVFPTIMVFLGLMPLYFGLQSETTHISILIIGFLICLFGVMMSYLADVHLTLHRKSNKSHQSIQSGVWKISRHPNYLGELSFWLGVFLMGYAYDVSKWFTVIGFIAMIILFQGYSIPTMEKRLLQSKKDYQMIRKTIPRLLPIFIKREGLKHAKP